jgi:hypothetical protein
VAVAGGPLVRSAVTRARPRRGTFGSVTQNGLGLREWNQPGTYELWFRSNDPMHLDLFGSL